MTPQFRRQLVGMLSAEGMSTRAIAPIVGKDYSTISRDLNHSEVLHVATPDIEPDPPEPEISICSITPVSAPSAATPEQRRRPLPPQIRYAAFDLEKAVTRLERLAEDDRFKKAVNIHDVNSVKWTLERLEKVAQAFESVGVTE